MRVQGTVYRNTTFNRQRFIYREGINAGSEFQVPIPVTPPSTGITISVSGELEDVASVEVTPIIISSELNSEMNVTVIPITIEMDVTQELVGQANGFDIEMIIGDTASADEYVELIEEV